MKQVYKVSDIVYSQDDEQLKELYTLLTENYVEDDDNMFRFDYSPEFLKWSVSRFSQFINTCIVFHPFSQSNLRLFK